MEYPLRFWNCLESPNGAKQTQRFRRQTRIANGNLTILQTFRTVRTPKKTELIRKA